jgi:LmbE family N-acetylglucosaminyl deacetylase
VANVPIARLPNTALDNLSLAGALGTIREIAAMVAKRQQDDIVVVAETVPETSTVARECREHLQVVVPPDNGYVHKDIAVASAGLYAVESAVGSAGEHVLGMSYALTQAAGQLALAFENLQTYEARRTALGEDVTHVHIGRQQAIAALDAYTTHTLEGR